MSKKDYELVADTIYSLNMRSSIPQVSAGMRRRTVALAFAKAFRASYPNFDEVKFMLRAENGV